MESTERCKQERMHKKVSYIVLLLWGEIPQSKYLYISNTNAEPRDAKDNNACNGCSLLGAQHEIIAAQQQPSSLSFRFTGAIIIIPLLLLVPAHRCRHQPNEFKEPSWHTIMLATSAY